MKKYAALALMANMRSDTVGESWDKFSLYY
jgi:hypothetical protein